MHERQRTERSPRTWGEAGGFENLLSHAIDKVENVVRSHRVRAIAELKKCDDHMLQVCNRFVKFVEEEMQMRDKLEDSKRYARSLETHLLHCRSELRKIDARIQKDKHWSDELDTLRKPLVKLLLVYAALWSEAALAMVALWNSIPTMCLVALLVCSIVSLMAHGISYEEYQRHANGKMVAGMSLAHAFYVLESLHQRQHSLLQLRAQWRSAEAATVELISNARAQEHSQVDQVGELQQARCSLLKDCWRYIDEIASGLDNTLI